MPSITIYFLLKAVLKNNFDDNSNYCGWAMATIKPTLLTLKINKPTCP